MGEIVHEVRWQVQNNRKNLLEFGAVIVVILFTVAVILAPVFEFAIGLAAYMERRFWG